MKRRAAGTVLLSESCPAGCCNVMVVAYDPRLTISGYCSPYCCGACRDFVEALLTDENLHLEVLP